MVELVRRNSASLRTILFAGEVFPQKYLKQLAEMIPHVDLFNLYGPTETNVCTYYQVDRATLPAMDKLPIGHACANTEVFAVDDQDRIVDRRRCRRTVCARTVGDPGLLG